MRSRFLRSRPSAHYDGAAGQVFGDAGYRFAIGCVAVEFCVAGVPIAREPLWYSQTSTSRSARVL
jgi:hypothetical protein